VDVVIGLFLFTLAAGNLSPSAAIDPPTAAESGMPFLSTSRDGRVYLSWIDYLPDQQHALRFAEWTGKAWTPPETIAQGKHWFINWADFASIVPLPGGALRAHWLTRAEGGGTYGYGIRVAQRDPERATWRQIHGMSLDEKVDYAGFLSFSPQEQAAVYLAPPADYAHGHAHEHRKTARFVEFRADGGVLTDQVIDADVCSCCQTAIGRTPDGWILAYRDHLPGEIRDISVVRYANKIWSAPRPVHQDGWKINGCPTDGPSLVTHQDQVAVTWLTRANGQPKVQIALSANRGANFSQPIRIDQGNPLGRPSVLVFDQDSYLVTWLEKTPDGQVQILLRRVSLKGKAGAVFVAATAPGGRAAGFPKIAVTGQKVFVAWRDTRVRARLFDKEIFSKD
jgi:hypothetical protein